MKYRVTYEFETIQGRWRSDFLDNNGKGCDEEEAQEIVEQLRGRENLRNVEIEEYISKTYAIFIDGDRSGYSPDQIDDCMTIGDLIDHLSELADASPDGNDTRVMIRNDRGYTYGRVSWDTVALGSYDEDGEVELDADF